MVVNIYIYIYIHIHVVISYINILECWKSCLLQFKCLCNTSSEYGTAQHDGGSRSAVVGLSSGHHGGPGAPKFQPRSHAKKNYLHGNWELNIDFRCFSICIYIIYNIHQCKRSIPPQVQRPEQVMRQSHTRHHPLSCFPILTVCIAMASMAALAVLSANCCHLKHPCRVKQMRIHHGNWWYWCVFFILNYFMILRCDDTL